MIHDVAHRSRRCAGFERRGTVIAMTRRYAYLGVVLGVLFALGGGITALPACYEVPRPTCGFRCGPDGECPDDYACSSDDGRCHLNGSAPMVCATPDAGIDVDGPPDSAFDAGLDGSPDATPDARPDAAPDARPDATPDATPDASPDAALDAAIDAP